MGPLLCRLFSSCGKQELLPICCTWASHCGGSLLLWHVGSRHMGLSSCGLWALEYRLSSCGTWARLLHSMWYLPRSGIELMSPALAGGFFTTEPPGKPQGIL